MKNEFMPDWEAVEIYDDAFVVVPIEEIKTEDAQILVLLYQTIFLKQFFNILLKFNVT